MDPPDIRPMAVSRILLQTVGTGRLPDPTRTDDRGNPVWNALWTVIAERRPDLVIQLCSQKTFDSTIPLFDTAMLAAGLSYDVAFRRVITAAQDGIRSAASIGDPSTHSFIAHHDDVESLARVYSRLIDEMREEFPDSILEVDFTSGTKAMSAALVVAAVSRRVSGLVYATGERDAGGRVQETTSVRTVSSGPLVANDDLAELGSAFDQGQFVAVAQQAKHLADDLKDGEEAARAQTLARLAKLYDPWDRFAWKTAASSVIQRGQQHKFAAELTECGWDATVFEQQMAHLERCAAVSFTADRLVDLLENARRRHERGRFDDCVARLYRLVEYLGQLRFQTFLPDSLEGHSPNPTKSVPLEILRRHGPTTTDTFLEPKAGKDRTVSLGLEHVMRWLGEAGDPIAIGFLDIYDDPDKGRRRGPIGNLLQLRNDSLLAHGLSPIAEAGSRELLVHAERLVRGHLADIGRDADQLISIARFLRCPWARRRQFDQSDFRA